MPKYKNYTNATIVVPSGECSPVEADATVTTKGYIRDTNGLTLLDHDVQRRRPFLTLLKVAPGSGQTISGLEAYDSILVKNFSGNEITITPNSDTTNQMVMADNEIMTFANKTPSGVIEWSQMRITGSGTDPLYVYGYKED